MHGVVSSSWESSIAVLAPLSTQCLWTFIESPSVPFPMPDLGSLVGGLSEWRGTSGTLTAYWW